MRKEELHKFFPFFSEGFSITTSFLSAILFHFFIINYFAEEASIFYPFFGLAGFLNLFFDLGLLDIYLRKVVDSFDYFGKLVKISFLSSFFSSFVAGLVFGEWGPFFYTFPFFVYSTVVRAYHNSYKFFKKHFLELSFSLVRLFVVFSSFLLGFELFQLFPIFLIFLVPYVKYLKEKLVFFDIKDVISLRISKIFNNVVSFFDSFMLSVFMGREFVPLYNAFVYIPKTLTMVVSRLNISLVPSFVRGLSKKYSFLSIIIFLLAVYFVDVFDLYKLFSNYDLEGYVHFFYFGVGYVFFNIAYSWGFSDKKFSALGIASIVSFAFVVFGWVFSKSIEEFFLVSSLGGLIFFIVYNIVWRFLH